MRKIISLLKACMTSDMSIFKIKAKNNNRKSNLFLMIFIALAFMFSIWSYANLLFEKMAPLHFQFIVLSIFVFLISIFTLVEGIYKSSSLIFNCRDDQLLLSLPIKRRTVLFIRIFKFYIFELLFGSMFMIPLVVAYIRWADNLEWHFFLTSFVMLFMIPIIPIVLSCIIGVITASLASRFKYKNVVQIVVTMILLLILLYGSYNLDGIFNYLVKHASSINDLITKIYYPAGVYARLAINFNFSDLIIFILSNIFIFIIMIFILSKFYFKINSRLKRVITTKKVNVSEFKYKTNSIYGALIKKELGTFFKIPVFIINAGFGLVLFIVAVIGIVTKFDNMLSILTDSTTINISKDLIMGNLSILIFVLILVTAYMTSITNSVISLEGRNINILKSLPVKGKTILMAKIYSSLILTTPVLVVGDIMLFIKFKISVIEMILLILLSVLIPLVSHFLGLLINLKFPKLDAESSTEIVKQSTSSFIAVMIGMILLVINIMIIVKIVGLISSTLILFMVVILYIIIDVILYFYLVKVGVLEFNNLSV